MAAVFAVVRIAIVIALIPCGGIARIDQRHVALAAFDGFARVALVVPMARGPIVVLVLQLDPTDAIDLLIDELLVAGRAIFGLLEHALAQLVMLGRIGDRKS